MKKGFTLIELLAVILILGIIALIAIPTVNSILNESRRGAFRATVNQLQKSIENNCSVKQIKNDEITYLYTIKNGEIFPKIEIKGDLPDGNIVVDKDCGVTFELYNINNEVNKKDTNQEINIIDNVTKKTRYKDPILNGADPELNDGLIPVIIENDGTVKKANSRDKWYDYSNKHWANAILVKENKRINYMRADSNSIINQDDILAYFVWIPRYKYKLFNVSGNEATYTDGICTANCPQPIEIIFENKTTNKSLGTENNQYRTHPAFTFGGKEINGLWVAKFELTGSNTSPTFLPNQRAYNSGNLSSKFNISLLLNDKKKYGIEMDSHVIKNSEWGAVAYLSHSIYGTNKQVVANNNNAYTTGCGALDYDLDGTDSCDNMYGTVSIYPQSTSGNISGIFDMAGCTYEVVMGNIENSKSNSGFTTMPDSKYFDSYTTNSKLGCNGEICYGHALAEVSYWYTDYWYYIYSGLPWYHRGGNFSEVNRTGLFFFSGNRGDWGGTRFTLIPQN